MDYSINEQKRTILKRNWIFLKNFTESLLGPFILLLAIILRVKTGYKEGQKLILMADHGKFPKNTKTTFIKLYDNKNPFEKSLLAVKIDKVNVVLPEYMLKEPSYLKRFLTAYEFNATMIKGTRRLGKNHPFLVMKVLYRIAYFPVDVFLWVKGKFVKEKNEV